MPQSDGLAEGEFFAGYTIVRRLGTGGMGQVYLAQHIATDEPAFSFRVPAAATKGKAIDVEIIRRHRIQPAVVRREWARAAIVAANGLDVAPS